MSRNASLINGNPPFEAPFATLAGKEITLTVDRGGKESEMKMTVGSRESTSYSLAEIAGPSAQQLKIRESWLKR